MSFWTQSLTNTQYSNTVETLARDSRPRTEYFVLVALSCAIATFGLITDAPAVVIGSMLVAPLLPPVLGLSLATATRRPQGWAQAFAALAIGAAAAVVLSAVIAWVAHGSFGLLNSLPHEVLARTQPTWFDLGIALAGGAVGAYAMSKPSLAGALPGVSIATALMPPLCVVGIGLAVGNPAVLAGAFTLFLINIAAIILAGLIMFVWLGFRPQLLK